MTNKNDIVTVFDKFLDSRLRDVHTVLPGQFETYDETTRKAMVKPLVKLKTTNNKDIQINPIDNVPVIFPGTKKFIFHYPIIKGDGCLLLFSESPIGNFLNSAIEQNSDDLNRFQLTDCIAIPGLWSFTNTPTAPTIKIEIDQAEAINIESTAGTIKIEASGNITMNNGTEPFVKGTQYQTDFTTFMTVLSNITPGNEAANAVALGQIKSAAIAFLSTLSNHISAQIKGM